MPVTQHDFLCFSTNTANNCQILLDLAFCFLFHAVYYANLENEIGKNVILFLHPLVTKKYPFTSELPESNSQL